MWNSYKLRAIDAAEGGVRYSRQKAVEPVDETANVYAEVRT